MSTGEESAVAFEFDRDSVWERVRGRKAVYLDMNVWIDMADGRKADAQPIKDQLREQVKGGKVFCPLFTPLIWELYKQEHSLQRTGELMGELSLDVCFTPSEEVFAWEVSRFAARLADQVEGTDWRKFLFVPVSAYLSSRYTITFAAGTPLKLVGEYGQVLSARQNTRTLVELLSLRDGAMRDCLKTMTYEPRVSHAATVERFGRDRRRIERVEAETVFLHYILPALHGLPADLKLLVLSFAGNAQRDAFGGCLPTLLAELPALCNHVEAMTRASEDPNRKDRVNDFFDLDMLSVPPAYADVFVTQDKWVRERFLKPGGFLKRSGCVFCSTYPELETWLDTSS
jgi:hypothetical protein